MSHCCVESVPPDSSFEAFHQPVVDWQARLTAGLNRILQATDQTLGHIEEEIARRTRDLERTVAEEAAQKKADQAPPHCPCCGAKLTRLTTGHERTFQTRFGAIQIQRARGWCRRCKAWQFPADHLLGLAGGGNASPAVQEMAALVGSKMPITEASAVIERLTGVVLPRATLDREARRQGQRATRKRTALDAAMRTAPEAQQVAPAAATPGPPTPKRLLRWSLNWMPGISANATTGGKASSAGRRARSRHGGIGFMAELVSA